MLQQGCPGADIATGKGVHTHHSPGSTVVPEVRAPNEDTSHPASCGMLGRAQQGQLQLDAHQQQQEWLWRQQGYQPMDQVSARVLASPL
jgi:hypothetical protein